MEPIPGIDLGKLDEQAVGAFRKIVQARVSDHLRGLYVQLHNLQTKADRLRHEATLSDSAAATIRERIDRLRAGDWSAVEPFEVADGTPKESK